MARITTRTAKNDTQARSLAMSMYLQNGLPIIRHDEELGMRDLEFEDVTQLENGTIKESIESAKKAGETSQEASLMVNKAHKLPARKPMPWNNAENSGSSDRKPRLKGKKIDHANAVDEIADSHGVSNFHRELAGLKREASSEDGGYYLLPTSNNSYVCERNLEDQKVLVAASLDKDAIEPDIDPEFKQERLVTGNYQLKDRKPKSTPHAEIVLTGD